MPEPSKIDFAGADSWFGFRPGMTHTEVRKVLKAQDVEAEEDDDGYLMATVQDYALEFIFAEDGSERARQISIDGKGVQWNGQEILGARLHEALRALQPRELPMWEANDAIGNPFRELKELPALPLSDTALFEEATVWLPDRGLGLVMCVGEIAGFVWRPTQDLPARYVGPVNEAQLALSQRADLPAYVRQERSASYRASIPRDPMAPLIWLMTLAAIAALAFVGREGFREGQRWSHHEVLNGKLVDVGRGPRKQFRDYLPPPLSRFWPSEKNTQTDLYRISYHAPDGQPGEVLFESADFYIAPREPGDDAPLAYLAGNPPEVKGVTRARDVGFIEHVPRAIAIGVLYLAGRVVLYVLSRVFSKRRNVKN